MPQLRVLVFLSAWLAIAPVVQAGHGHFCGGGGGVSFAVGFRPLGGYGYRPRLYNSFYYGGGYPYLTPGCYGGYNPYGIYYSPYYGYSNYALPPVFAPAELLYGPRAVKQFLAIDEDPPVAIRDDAALPDKSKPRISNPEYRRKADQFIAYGDALFREQKYAQAIDRYKRASEFAPDVPETHWRKGHAYVAMHRYELAAAAFKRALALKGDIDRAGFTLTGLYGPGATVKTTHLEALAGETLVRRDDSDLYFLLGVLLRYDGQRERAEKFFVRAAELAGPAADHLARLLATEEAAPVSLKEWET